MPSSIENEWDRVTGSKERRLAKEIDVLSAEGLPAIRIASRLNVKIAVVWDYLRNRSPGALRGQRRCIR